MIGGGNGGFQDHGPVCDPFDIVSAKNASLNLLKRWRQVALVVNASRRFRYTLDLKKEEEKKKITAEIRTHAQVIRAAYLFQTTAGSKPDGAQKAPSSPIPTGDYNVSPEQLASMTRDHDFSALQNFGGVKGVAAKLKTSPDKGIHDDEFNILERKNVFGSNTYPRKKGRSFWRFLFDARHDTTLIILMVAAAASVALGIKTEGIKEGWYDGGSIALAVIIVIVVTAIRDYKQSLQFRNLNKEKQNIQLQVVRGGRRMAVSIYDIVVGDVIPLNIGDQVPADGILISGHSLAIDESTMTGESEIVHKDQKSPFLMSGCKVANGYGTMLATSVGINTEWGLLMASISEDDSEETPLHVRLNGVAAFTSRVGLVVAVSVLVILLIRFFTGHTRDPDGHVQFSAGKTSVWDAVDGAIKFFTISPEGFQLAVILTLAYSMPKMFLDKALVRRLSACETMGSVTTICSDKTGTLTLNVMTVVEAYICGKKIDPPNSTSELPSRIVSLLIESVAQNTTGSVFLPEGGNDVEVSGSPTEKAILQWGVELGMNFDVVRSECSVIHAFPFNSEKKRGGAAVKLPDSEVHVHWKGAAEIVLAACTRYMDSNEQLVPLDEGKVEYFRKVIEDMAAGSLRCVAIAYRPCKEETVPTDEELAHWQLPEGDLVLLAIIGLKDPCRPGVRDAVQLCVKAGVKVRMVTGDNLQTARAIALECGILASIADATEPNLIEGKSFRALSEGQQLEVAERILVMGRSSPNDKLLLVQALRKRGHVVAVTGDGPNDAPALHEADVGLAMGIQGTEVAKESSDIIILDDNFASVVKVVRWGRSVYANIQKSIQFQLTMNVSVLIINVATAVSLGDNPLNVVQLLWVNLIMDTLGALALVTEPPTDHLMDRLPVGRREPLITYIMWKNLLIQAFYQVSVILVLHFRGRQLLHTEHDLDEHAIKEKNTLIFNAFVFAQVFNVFNARKPNEMNVFKGVTRNRLFMGIMGLVVVLQVIIIMFLGKFTTTVRLSWQLWLFSIAIGFFSWPVAVIGKLIPVFKKPFSEYFTHTFASYSSPQRNRGAQKAPPSLNPTGDYNVSPGQLSSVTRDHDFSALQNFEGEEEKKKIIANIRTHVQVIRAAYLFQAAAGYEPDGAQKAPPSPIPTGDYNVSPEKLASMTRDHDFAALQNFGGVKGVAEKLKTSPEKGIHDDESNILERKNVFGANTYPRKKGRSFWRFLLDACRDTTLIILMVAAAASLALGIKTEGIKEGWYDGGSIALAVIIVIVVTAISDYKQSLQFQSLNEEKQNIQLEVVRGGRRVDISIFDIVVGDVIPLKIGDQVPADGILISGQSLAIDESSMTGESKIVHKDHKSPFLMSGCKVADGYGTMLATSVGINTEWGLLMASISEDNGEETPLQVRLNGVATFIGIVGLVVAVFVLVILLIRFFTGHTTDDQGRVEFTAGKTSIGDAVDGAIKIFTVAVTIVVVAVPEGLPLAVTLTLAYSMRKMMVDKALVRRLSACETMGSATTICSDKTGTLTLNMMTVVEAYICGKKIDPPSSTSELPSRIVSLLIESVAQNTTGSVFLAEGGSDVEISGSPTEKAILQWGVKLGMNFDVVRSESSIIHAFPFNSEKKRGGVAVKLPDSEVHVHWKGAAEIILAACTRYMDSNEQLVPLDEGKVEYFRKAIEDMAAGSLRCVAIAYRPCKGETVPTDEDELAHWELPEGDLVLLAIIGLKDPCRPGVRDAVELCVKAGVKVRMVTGDNLHTARAIALECGILASNADAEEPNLIEGKSFRAMSEGQRLEIAERISVMGRSSPNDKLLLVQALRKRGHVVAVTGDGTNDAPALHEADIGLAMGIQGTEVAKESSDIIILDDNFASVVKVVRWGRSVYANIQKFIQFQLTVNVAALIINVVAAVSSGDVPLNAVQLLWVNLIMDTLGALALATEPPTDHLMDRHPVGRREPLITNIMWRNLLIQAFYQVSVLLVLNFRGRELLHSKHDPDAHAIKEKNTLIFNAFVFAQVFNEFNARKPDEMNVFKGVTKNRLFMGIVGLTVVLQVMIIMFLGKFTTTVRLSWQLWLVSIVIGVISWPLAVVGKLIPVSERPFSEYFTKIFASCTCHRNRGSSRGNEDDA